MAEGCAWTISSVNFTLSYEVKTVYIVKARVTDGIGSAIQRYWPNPFDEKRGNTFVFGYFLQWRVSNQLNEYFAVLTFSNMF